MKVEPQIVEAFDNAVRVIRESNVYRHYRDTLARVKEVPGLKEKLDEFRVRNFEMQNAGNLELEQIEEFESQYDAFRENPLVADFLAAELSYCRMIQAMEKKIVTEIEFE